MENKNKLLDHHINYLREETPLSKRQSQILAHRHLGDSPEEIAEALEISPNTVNKHWNHAVNKLEQGEVLSDIFFGETPEYSPDDRPSWQWPWEQLVRAEFEEGDASISLRLYVDPVWNTNGYDYLLVETRTKTPQKWQTTQEKTWSVCDEHSLRQTIYQDAESLFGWAVREKVLETAGIDPGADGAISTKKAFGVEWSSEEVRNASEDAESVVERSPGQRF